MMGYEQFQKKQYNTIPASHHGIFRCDTRNEENTFDIFSVKFGKKHGLLATARGQIMQEPDYYMLYRDGELIQSAKSIF